MLQLYCTMLCSLLGELNCEQNAYNTPQTLLTSLDKELRISGDAADSDQTHDLTRPSNKPLV